MGSDGRIGRNSLAGTLTTLGLWPVKAKAKAMPSFLSSAPFIVNYCLVLGEQQEEVRQVHNVA